MSNWMLAAAIGAVPCAVAVVIAAYAVWLRQAPPERRRAPREPIDWPAVDIIVAVFNERALLDGKLQNLAALAYPPDRLRFIVVDGASTDGSLDVATAWSRRDARFVVHAAGAAHKAAQLNLALRHARAPWVVVSDADARMPRQTLRAIMAAASEDPAIGLVGSPVLPVDAHPAEQIYWRLLNWFRRHEWRRGSASMVTAPCYAFRRALIHQFPLDVQADDIFIAWHIGSAGHAIGLAGPVVRELRAPSTIRTLFSQKVRRGSGILREALRFAPAVGGMTRPLRAAFLFRVAMFLLGPPLVASAAAMGLAILTFAPVLATLLTVGAATLLWHPSGQSFLRTSLALLAVLPLAASAAVLVYPFWRRTVP